jgi:hypothetical protein
MPSDRILRFLSSIKMPSTNVYSYYDFYPSGKRHFEDFLK